MYQTFDVNLITGFISDTVTFISGAVQATITQLFQSAAGPLLLISLVVIVFFWVVNKFKVSSNSSVSRNDFIGNSAMIMNAHSMGLNATKDDYIKDGSIEDLMNKHYGYKGREKENRDRAFINSKYGRG
jgi:hypothetical protein